MSYLPKETLCFWSLPTISDRIYDIWSEIDGVHSRQEKSIWSLLVELGMIYDYVNIDNVRSSLQLLCTLFWGSGRAARQDDYIWINTIIFEYSETSFEYCHYEGPGEQPGRTTLNEITRAGVVSYRRTLLLFSWTTYCISLTRIVDDRRQPRSG